MNCFIPKNSKFKKYFLITYKNMSYKSYKLIFGNIGFKSIVSGYLTSKQLVLIKKIFSHNISLISTLFLICFPFYSQVAMSHYADIQLSFFMFLSVFFAQMMYFQMSLSQ